ncbi:uncharacterized protein SCHCODRAFT_02586504 [Schizophyllum commune H4-8]|uniref:uncharacterized protein n=1 Tax=Schizophyllum commune (strain H4-8 / FGSC 9210) TaxID=578458 RepID=UPI00215FB8BB|nr:uncharacterized protein SCHCODRAFT_02586504 [Schizophyllum commune H4-8]KAI5889717.1 hypothetical protein SCHCODRAFT_02586504 [Schizophyllum commune H4-8]
MGSVRPPARVRAFRNIELERCWQGTEEARGMQPTTTSPGRRKAMAKVGRTSPAAGLRKTIHLPGIDGIGQKVSIRCNVCWGKATERDM